MPILELINKDFRDCEIPKGLVITDPPYNIGYKYNLYKDNLSEKEYIELISKIPTPCVLFHFPEETINIFSKAMSVKCEEVVAWTYSTRTKKHHRLITWWGCKPDFSKVKEPYAPYTLKDPRNQHKLKDGRDLKDVWNIQYVKGGGRPKKDGTPATNKEKTDHPCQIPEEVIKRIILTTATEGQVIIDPFAGSGTTNKVAYELGYDSYGYEIDPKYYEIMKQRINR
jgi:DNA modification methylase